MSETLSVSHKGNSKLGPNISILSRAVGDSCPDSCLFLDNNCYAQKTERRFNNARLAGLKNMKIADWQKIRAFLLDATKRGNDVRYNERGDMLKTTKNDSKILDIKYIKSIVKANESIIEEGNKPPQQFLYSHVYKKEVAQLAKLGISVFASVTTIGDYKQAKSVGFTRFAWSTTLRKGKDKNKIWIAENGDVVPVCWEQLGQGKTKGTCGTCQYCINPKLGSIAFLNH